MTRCHGAAPAGEEYQGLLHSDVLKYMANEHGSLVMELVELARLQVIELGEAENALRTINAVLAITPESKLPGLKEHLWMEGVACFYAGQWERGARHFEAEMAVNDCDVEVPVWRWLCDAKNPQLGVQQARARLLGCKHDVRPPFPEIWIMFKGAGGSDEVHISNVLTAAEHDGTEDAKMWAHFYIGLYLEALGSTTEADKYFKIAAETNSHQNIAKLARAHFLRLQRQAACTTWTRLSEELTPLLAIRGKHQVGISGCRITRSQ